MRCCVFPWVDITLNILFLFLPPHILISTGSSGSEIALRRVHELFSTNWPPSGHTRESEWMKSHEVLSRNGTYMQFKCLSSFSVWFHRTKIEWNWCCLNPWIFKHQRLRFEFGLFELFDMPDTKALSLSLRPFVTCGGSHTHTSTASLFCRAPFVDPVLPSFPPCLPPVQSDARA